MINKWAFIAFGLYILVLACLPCQDKWSTPKLGQHTSFYANQKEKLPQKPFGSPNSQEKCSPLCAMCASVVLSKVVSFEFLAPIQLPKTVVKSLYSVFESHLPLDAAWQPPQFV